MQMKINKCKMKKKAQIHIRGRKRDKKEIIMTIKDRNTQKFLIGHI